MELSKKNARKNKMRTYGLEWVDDPTPINKRVCGSGVMFSGHYEKVKKR